MFNKGSLRRLGKTGWAKQSSGENYFNFEQYESRESSFTPYDEVTKQKEEESKKIINDEAIKYKELETKEKEIQTKLAEERKKREPQPMDIDTVPSDMILEPPKIENSEKKFIPVQKQVELGNERVYYTQIIKK